MCLQHAGSITCETYIPDNQKLYSNDILSAEQRRKIKLNLSYPNLQHFRAFLGLDLILSVPIVAHRSSTAMQKKKCTQCIARHRKP